MKKAPLSPKDLTTISEATKQILFSLGEDTTREGLLETPNRAAKAWSAITSGYHADIDGMMTTFDGEGYDQMVLLRDIEFYSTCEHHLLPFFGKAHVAYIPGEKIVGLSKLARVVDVFARRLQNQERLTSQIADCLIEHLEPKGVAIMLQGQHMCMMSRGVMKQDASMTTTCLRGVFHQGEPRAEFFSSIKI